MTLTYSEIMVRYGELSTKGKNRMRFINKLRNNIKDVLSIYPEVKVTFDRDRGHIYLNGTDYEPVAESLKQIFLVFKPLVLFTSLKRCRGLEKSCSRHYDWTLS